MRLLLCTALLFFTAPLPVDLSAAEPDQDPPSFILIVLDDLGTEQLGMYGQPHGGYADTPKLDDLRSEGVLFTAAHVQPSCAPTRACLLTGRYAFRTGMGTQPGNFYKLPLSEETLPEVLSAGTSGQYKSGAFGKWHLTTHTDYEHVVDSGFDRFDGVMGNIGSYYNWDMFHDEVGTTSTTTEFRACQPGGGCTYDESNWVASETTRRAADWINAQTGPYFAYVAYNPPHTPYEIPPLTLLGPTSSNEITSNNLSPGDDVPDGHLLLKKASLDWMIESTDEEIRKLLEDEIDPAQLTNTTIIIIGDNGTEPGVVDSPPYDPLHAKGSVYELGTRVPMLVVGPTAQPNSTCDALVDAVDVWATIAEMAGVSPTQGQTIDGVSFEDLLANPGMDGDRDFGFVQRFSPTKTYVPNPLVIEPLSENERAIQSGIWKYLRLREHVGYSMSGVPIYAESHQVYDVVTDPQEGTNLYFEYVSGPGGQLTQAEWDAIDALVDAMDNLSGL